MTELPNSKSRFRGYWLSTTIAISLYVLVDIGVLLGESNRFISTGESAFLLIISWMLGLLLAAILSGAFLVLPVPNENLPWAGFVMGLLVIWLIDQSLSFEFISEIGLLPLSTMFVAFLLAVAMVYRPPKPKFRISLVLALSFGLAGRLATAPPRNNTETPPKNAPNLMLITIDSIRLDPFISKRADSLFPNLSSLADQGVFFSGVAANAVDSTLSHHALLTSLGPWKKPTEQTLASHLSLQGYDTAAFIGDAALSDLSRSSGFMKKDDDFGWAIGLESTIWGRLADRMDLLPTHREDVSTIDRFRSWLVERSDFRPFFAWLHLHAPTCPYSPPPPHNADHYDGDPYDPGHEGMPSAAQLSDCQKASLKGVTDPSWAQSQYLGELTALDGEIGNIIHLLSEKNHAEDTLLVVAGAHGENLGEDGAWFNHGLVLNDAALFVPVWMRFAGVLPQNRQISTKMELVDLSPTILEIMVSDAMENTEGRSFVQAIYGAGIERSVLRSARFENGEMEVSIHANGLRYSNEASRLIEDPDQRAIVESMIESYRDALVITD